MGGGESGRTDISDIWEKKVWEPGSQCGGWREIRQIRQVEKEGVGAGQRMCVCGGRSGGSGSGKKAVE